MTLFQKGHVLRMRSEGKSYSKIAAYLGISENTIKSFCQRNNLGVSNAALKVENVSNNGTEALNFCKNCGKTIEQRSGKKPRKFCSDKCRMTWWNSHTEEVSKKSIYHLECEACNKPFESYGNMNRKYCTHSCYINDRFMKGVELKGGTDHNSRAI